jgi:hypothetical protein
MLVCSFGLSSPVAGAEKNVAFYEKCGFKAKEVLMACYFK